ncbi:MAG TPA: cytochrome c maturation protein CcmE, partial [Casimicrobiaceae bacterium]
MKPRHKRFAWIGAGVVVIGIAAALVLNAFQSNLVFFFTPTQVVDREAPQGRAFRIGGLVESGSLVRDTNSLTVHFRVTDTAKTIPVVYTGLLP